MHKQLLKLIDNLTGICNSHGVPLNVNITGDKLTITADFMKAEAPKPEKGSGGRRGGAGRRPRSFFEKKSVHELVKLRLAAGKKGYKATVKLISAVIAEKNQAVQAKGPKLRALPSPKKRRAA